MLTSHGFYYEVHGQGRPLLLIAGLGCDCLVWSSILEPLAKNHQVVIFDNRGVGRSPSPPEEYTASRMAEDTFALLQELKIPKATVLGHSMGGAIAQEFVRRYPEVTEKLILCCTSMKFSPVCLAMQRALLSMRQEGCSLSLMVDTVLPWLYSRDFLSDSKRLDSVREGMLHPPYPQSNQGFAGQHHVCASFDSTSWVESLTPETLVIAGGEDLLCPSDPLALAKGVRHSRFLEFPKTGHLPFVEDPQAFVQHVNAFLG